MPIVDDASGLDRDVRPPRRRAGAVDDLAAGNQQVIARLDQRHRPLASQGDQQQDDDDKDGSSLQHWRLDTTTMLHPLVVAA